MVILVLKITQWQEKETHTPTHSRKSGSSIEANGFLNIQIFTLSAIFYPKLFKATSRMIAF